MYNLINTAGIVFAFSEYQGGSSYEAELRNSKCYTQGIRILANGDKYEGEFFKGKLDGQGKLILVNGDRYKGEFLNGKRTGKGIYTWANGEMYEGEFLDGVKNGQGIQIFANGDKYEGEFFKGKQHGQGIYIWTHGNKYEGEFLDGKLHGQGILTYANGDIYQGEFLNNKRNGKGVHTLANEHKFEGIFRDDQEKQGTFTSCGLTFTCEFHNGHPISDISHMNDSLFLGMLTQKSKALTYAVYGLGIITDYLLKKHYIQGNALEKTRKTCFAIASSSEAILIESEKIHSTLQTLGHPVLLLLQSLHHIVGLQMVRKVEGFVDFEIYNSGDGLKYHEKHPFKANTFQTCWRKRVPLGVVTPDKLQPFLKRFANIYEAYEAIINLPESESIGGDTTVWQKAQKQNNCSLMWIFAYLRNNMDAREYTAMRLQLFQDCILTVENSVSPDQEMLGHLEKKVAKLADKMKADKEVELNIEAHVSKVGMRYISC